MTLGVCRTILCYYLLVGIGLVSLTCLKMYSARHMINREPDKILQFPSSVTDVNILIKVAKKVYVPRHYEYIATLFSVGYLHLQIFSTAGTVYLNLLSPHIFGYFKAVMICSGLQLIGSTGSFLLCNLLWKPIVLRLLTTEMENYRLKVRAFVKGGHWLTLGRYLVAIRIFPLIPNFLLNLLAPIIELPLWTFAVSTYLGSLPNMFLVVFLGTKIQDYDSFRDMMTSDERYFLLYVDLAVIAVLLFDPFTAFINYKTRTRLNPARKDRRRIRNRKRQ